MRLHFRSDLVGACLPQTLLLFRTVGAKERRVVLSSTMGVLYSNNDSFSDDQDYNDEDGKYEVLKKQMTSYFVGIT